MPDQPDPHHDQYDQCDECSPIQMLNNDNDIIYLRYIQRTIKEMSKAYNLMVQHGKVCEEIKENTGNII